MFGSDKEGRNPTNSSLLLNTYGFCATPSIKMTVIVIYQIKFRFVFIEVPKHDKS